MLHTKPIVLDEILQCMHHGASYHIPTAPPQFIFPIFINHWAYKLFSSLMVSSCYCSRLDLFSVYLFLVNFVSPIDFFLNFFFVASSSKQPSFYLSFLPKIPSSGVAVSICDFCFLLLLDCGFSVSRSVG